MLCLKKTMTFNKRNCKESGSCKENMYIIIKGHVHEENYMLSIEYSTYACVKDISTLQGIKVRVKHVYVLSTCRN